MLYDVNLIIHIIPDRDLGLLLKFGMLAGPVGPCQIGPSDGHALARLANEEVEAIGRNTND